MAVASFDFDQNLTLLTFEEMCTLLATIQEQKQQQTRKLLAHTKEAKMQLDLKALDIPQLKKVRLDLKELIATHDAMVRDHKKLCIFQEKALDHAKKIQMNVALRDERGTIKAAQLADARDGQQSRVMLPILPGATCSQLSYGNW